MNKHLHHTNLDLQAALLSGAVSLTALVARLVAPSLHPQAAEDLAQFVVATGIAALVALLRWWRRPADGDPRAIVTIDDALALAGTRQRSGERDEDALARAMRMRGWLAIREHRPPQAERVLVWTPGVGEELVRWGSGQGGRASYWRPLPEPPPDGR